MSSNDHESYAGGATNSEEFCSGRYNHAGKVKR